MPTISDERGSLSVGGLLLPGQKPKEKTAAEKLLEPGQVQSYQDIMGELPDTPRVDLSDILEARKKGLGGYTSEESAAFRSQMAGQLARQGQAQQRQLLAAQAKAGVRGGAAASQGQRLIQNIGAQRAAGEQELFIKNIAEQQRRQQQYEELTKSQRMANLAAEITRQQMAQAERESQRAQEAAKIPAAAQMEAPRKIICTELYRQGLMDHETYIADQDFGAIMWKRSPELMRGYHILAKPIVKRMKTSKTFTRVVNFFAKPWAQEMSFLMGVSKSGSITGKAILSVGSLICSAVGKLYRLKAEAI